MLYFNRCTFVLITLRFWFWGTNDNWIFFFSDLKVFLYTAIVREGLKYNSRQDSLKISLNVCVFLLIYSVVITGDGPDIRSCEYPNAFHDPQPHIANCESLADFKKRIETANNVNIAVNHWNETFTFSTAFHNLRRWACSAVWGASRIVSEYSMFGLTHSKGLADTRLSAPSGLVASQLPKWHTFL